MPPSLSHSGIVKRITADTIYVTVESTSQCAACHAKGFCTAADVAEKQIEIPYGGQAVKEGDEVTVALRLPLGLRAVWWAYVCPLLLLMIILLLLHGQNIPDLYSGLGAVMVLALYYGILWLFKDKLKRKYTFSLEI